MVLAPINPTIAQNFRDTFGVSQCPPFFETDTPITPVVQLTPTSVSVTQNFPTPGTNQTPIYIVNTGGKSQQSITSGTGALLHTTTAGKTLYIQSIAFGSGSNAGQFVLYDSTTLAGTIKVSGNFLVNNMFQMVFPTPIKFTNGIFADVNSTGGQTFTIVGWEE